MSLGAPKLYRVVVRHNLVARIEALPFRDDVAVPDSPLEVSSLLARNHRENGCLDGAYYFEDSETARHFAYLSLDFMKHMLEKSIESLDTAKVSQEGWRNPHWVKKHG